MVQAQNQSLVPVVVTLEWAVITDIDIVRLLLSELGEVRTTRRQVQQNNLLNERLGQQVHIVLVCLGGGVARAEIELDEKIVSERAER